MCIITGMDTPATTDYFSLATDLAKWARAGYPTPSPQPADTGCLPDTTDACLAPAADDPVRLFYAAHGMDYTPRCLRCHRELTEAN